jgi:hypothetical protein
MAETAETSLKDEVKILSKGVGKWKVKLRLPMEYVQGNLSLFKKINQVKKQLAKMLELPSGLLEYGEIVNKEIREDHLAVTLEISRKAAPGGPIAVHILPGISEYNMEFPDMIATIDLYIYDTIGSLVTIDKIDKIIEKNKIAKELVHWEVIEKAIDRIMEHHQPILGTVFAQGVYPDSGQDAELIFPVFQGKSIEEVLQSTEDRRVKRGDLLLKKIRAKRGSRDGHNVRGELVKSPLGKEIKIEGDRGTITNLKETEITSQIDGLMMLEFESKELEVKSTLNGRKIEPTQVVRVSVAPVRIFSGDKIVDVCTNSAVEVRGNVKSGGKIISTSEIIVKGDVEVETILQSKEDIHIKGSIQGGSLTSQKNIEVSDEVSGAEITATEKVTIHTAASDATITGREVEIKELKGGKVVAKEKVKIGKVKLGDKEKKPEVRIGIADFHNNRVLENNKFIVFGNNNLDEMRNVFGEEIVEKVNNANLKAMLLKHIKEMRLTSRISYNRNQTEAIMRLLDSTASIRELLSEKISENQDLEEVIKKAMGALKELVILEGSDIPFEAVIGSQVVEIPETDQSIKCVQEGINDTMLDTKEMDA